MFGNGYTWNENIRQEYCNKVAGLCDWVKDQKGFDSGFILSMAFQLLKGSMLTDKQKQAVDSIVSKCKVDWMQAGLPKYLKDNPPGSMDLDNRQDDIMQQELTQDGGMGPEDWEDHEASMDADISPDFDPDNFDPDNGLPF